MQEWGIIAGIIGGGSLCTAVAKYFILDSLRELKTVSVMVHSIKAHCTSFDTYIPKIKKLEDDMVVHSNKITQIQTRLEYERQSRNPATH